jgi:hypothetical protein
MEMFLMVAAMTLLAVAVSAAAFAAATREPQGPEPQPSRPADRWPLPASGFFADDETPAGAHPAVPIEALLLQIERHVRLEQAAAEAFHAMPTPESLHGRTVSPLVH